MPLLDVDYVLLVGELAILAGCARFAWQAAADLADLRQLLASARELRDDLREAIASADSSLLGADVGTEPLEAEMADDGRSQRVLALSRLGLGSAEVANRMGISRGEAELLAKIGERHVSAGRV